MRAWLKKKAEGRGGRSPPRGRDWGAEPPPFANGSNTSRNTKKQ